MMSAEVGKVGDSLNGRQKEGLSVSTSDVTLDGASDHQWFIII